VILQKHPVWSLNGAERSILGKKLIAGGEKGDILSMDYGNLELKEKGDYLS
jgi:hypothetical protein